MESFGANFIQVYNSAIKIFFASGCKEAGGILSKSSPESLFNQVIGLHSTTY